MFDEADPYIRANFGVQFFESRHNDYYRRRHPLHRFRDEHRGEHHVPGRSGRTVRCFNWEKVRFSLSKCPKTPNLQRIASNLAKFRRRKTCFSATTRFDACQNKIHCIQFIQVLLIERLTKDISSQEDDYKSAHEDKQDRVQHNRRQPYCSDSEVSDNDRNG